MITSALHAQLEAARAVVNAIDYSAIDWQQKWDDAMAPVRALTAQIDAAKPAEEFCSIDSGVHRTRLLSGRII
jgi:hypothetical protein